MRILVTGGSGAFGSAFVKHCLAENLCSWIAVYSRCEHKQQRLATEIGEDPHDRLRFFLGDVRDRDRLQIAMRDATHVVHAAALKVVPWLEYNPDEACKTNVIGAMNVVEAVLRSASVKKVVAISTDKACSPVNIYGATKLCAEKLFTAANEMGGGIGAAFTVVRYGNVTGSTGSVVPLWRGLVEEQKPLPITSAKMTRFWMTLPDAVELVMAEIASEGGGDVVIPKLPSYKIIDLAMAVSCHGYEIEKIGLRPGEKLHESMVSVDEAPWTEDYGDHYRIHRDLKESAGGNVREITRGTPVPEGFHFSSDENDQWLTAHDLRERLKTIP